MKIEIAVVIPPLAVAFRKADDTQRYLPAA